MEQEEQWDNPNQKNSLSCPCLRDSYTLIYITLTDLLDVMSKHIEEC